MVTRGVQETASHGRRERCPGQASTESAQWPAAGRLGQGAAHPPAADRPLSVRQRL